MSEWSPGPRPSPLTRLRLNPNPNPNPEPMFYVADGAAEEHGFVNARTITHA